MKWEMREAKCGDIVRVSLGSFFHFGIFVSDEEIIQFGLPPTPGRRAEDVEVLSAPVDQFLAGGFLEVGVPEGKEKRRRKSPKEVVSAAKSRLGERGYDIIYNNCEHFANECYFGEKFCSMTDQLRAQFRAIPVVHVYVSKFPFEVERKEIVPLERAKEIESCSNENVRLAKYYVWKLLESALMRTFGLKIQNVQFTKNEYGRWECKDCCFSLSHSENLVAVALSRKSVGVDIERKDETRFDEKMAQKILTEREEKELEQTSAQSRGAALNVLWTKKEALFKCTGNGGFAPQKIETAGALFSTREIAFGEERYILTVASEDAPRAQFRMGEGLQ